VTDNSILVWRIIQETITGKEARYVLDMMEADVLSLGEIDRKILTTIIENFGAGLGAGPASKQKKLF
jgi:Holliday junction resolvasome RuvABC ATP-dependent DNA helicase subunit